MRSAPVPLPVLRSAGAALALLLAVLCAPVAWAGEDAAASKQAPTALPVKTKVNDANAKKQLLSEHPLTLQWLTNDNGSIGKAVVTEENGLLKLKGEQRDAKGYLTVEGVIETVDTRSFVLVGKVELRVDFLAGGKVCPREGRFTFRITGKRRYWRMKEMDNPCEENHVDYVDLFLR